MEQTKQQQREFDSEDGRRRGKLNKEYEQSLTTYNALKKEISLLEENIEDISFWALQTGLQLSDLGGVQDGA